MNIKMTSKLSPRQTASAAPKRVEKETKVNSESKNVPKLDTFESSASRGFGDAMRSGSVDGLHLDDPMPTYGSLVYFDTFNQDGIDLELLEK